MRAGLGNYARKSPDLPHRVKKLAHLFELCSHGWMHHPRWTWVLCVSRLLVCLAAITSLWGCTPAITWQALQAQGLGPKVTHSCIRPPPFGERGEFYTYNDTSHEMVSDEDAEAFWKAARTASTIYRYDPNAPANPGPSLPWPYHHMTCNEVSTGDVPELPEGMKEIIISRQFREAMVRALSADDLRRPMTEDRSDKPSPELVGQVLITPPNAENYTKAIQEIG